jgi:serine/threonine-protein kinase
MPAADFRAARERFLDEARILTRFHHPGIVDVFDSFQGNNTAYMVMEFLRGRSLQQVLDETGPVPEYEAVEYATRVGEALEAVHAARLLHRDIKPDNIMLTEDGRVVLIDFGTARTYAGGKTGRMTTLLTPGYAPLEQYGQQVRFGPYTDV